MTDEEAEIAGDAATETSGADHGAPGAAGTTVVPSASEILGRWREAERRRDAADSGTPERAAAEAECDELARAYQDAHSARAEVASDLAHRAAEPV